MPYLESVWSAGGMTGRVVALLCGCAVVSLVLYRAGWLATAILIASVSGVLMLLADEFGGLLDTDQQKPTLSTTRSAPPPPWPE